MGVLKVNTIQLENGNAPTAADLGFAAGSVLQVVTASDTTQTRTTTANSDVDLTLTATITPTSTTSKILVMLVAFVGENPNGGLYLKRGSTKIGGAGGTTQNHNHADNFWNSDDLSYNDYSNEAIAFNYLDSPSTTSATTYTLGYRGQHTSSVQFCYNRFKNNANSTQRSTIILMEIAG